MKMTKKELEGIKDIRVISGKDKIYKLSLADNSNWIVARKGKCDGKACKAACCKFFCIDSKNQYYAGFGSKTKLGVKVDVKCSYLCRNKCSRWGRHLPEACRQFPHPTDSTYHEVVEVCTFWFDKLYELK